MMQTNFVQNAPNSYVSQQFYKKNTKIFDNTQNEAVQSAAYDALALAASEKAVCYVWKSDNINFTTTDVVLWTVLLTHPSFSPFSSKSDPAGWVIAAVIAGALFTAMLTLGCAIMETFNSLRTQGKISQVEEKLDDPNINAQIKKVYKDILPLMQRERTDHALNAVFTYLIAGGLVVLTATAIIAYMAYKRSAPMPSSCTMMGIAGGSAIVGGTLAHLVKLIMNFNYEDSTAYKEEKQKVLDAQKTLLDILPNHQKILMEAQTNLNDHKVYYHAGKRYYHLTKDLRIDTASSDQVYRWNLTEITLPNG